MRAVGWVLSKAAMKAVGKVVKWVASSDAKRAVERAVMTAVT